jgi:putative transcriptional regulator
MKKINRIKEVLKEKGLYNRDLAKHLDKSETAISLWVNNRRQPSLEDLLHVAEFLNIDIRELLYQTKW